MARASAVNAAALSSSLSCLALTRTLRSPPMTADLAQTAPTPASEMLAASPCSAMALTTFMAVRDARMVRRGTSIACTVAASMAAALAAFCSSDALGRPKASMIFSNATVSWSTRPSSSSWHALPFSAHCENSSQRSSHPRLWALRFATIAASAAAREPRRAATDPPPGAGDSEAVSQTKSFTGMEMRREGGLQASPSMYSMIFFSGSNGARSSRPRERTAILMSSLSLTPSDRC
mmetsp:Transcript_19562/g.75111  ORF Transcript_19562/g.75111 Transcript_19562/m.75111 type:complete len:235 (+) Transcript_19562:131-835(+)